MKLVRYSPMMPRRMWQDLDEMFEDFASPSIVNGGFSPAVDIYEEGDNVIVEAPLPGINIENVEVSIENDVLTIEGKTEKKTEVEEKDYYRKEVREGSFHRAIALPTAVSGDKAEASYEHGVLKITAPKAAQAKKNTISIKK